MADLDDFFKKKDKKKGKSKSRFVSSELKQLEQAVSKEKEQSSKTNDETVEGGPTNENDDKDEEWGEFEESKRPDLSNLKLGQLTFNEEHHHQSSGGADNESENMSQYNNDGDSSENPWKKAQEQKQPKEQKPAAAAAAPEKPGVYVPRFMGEQQAAAAAKARKKNAPDLNSEAFFPSLGLDKPAEQVKNKKDGFKEVTHGHGIKKEQSTSSNFQIPVSTVYSSLFNNEVDS